MSSEADIVLALLARYREGLERSWAYRFSDFRAFGVMLLFPFLAIVAGVFVVYGPLRHPFNYVAAVVFLGFSLGFWLMTMVLLEERAKHKVLLCYRIAGAITRIYFISSISGGRDVVAWRRDLVEHLLDTVSSTLTERAQKIWSDAEQQQPKWPALTLVP